MTVPMTQVQAAAAIREGVRRAVYRSKLTKEKFSSWTIRTLREDLDDAIGWEVGNEPQRLMMLNVSIRRVCRLKYGKVVQVPATGWYTHSSRQDKNVEVLVDHILSKPMDEA